MSTPNPDSLSKAFKVNCPNCESEEVVEVGVELLDFQGGSLTRIGVVHTCLEKKPMLLVLYIDQNYMIRMKSVLPVLQKNKQENAQVFALKEFYVPHPLSQAVKIERLSTVEQKIVKLVDGVRTIDDIAETLTITPLKTKMLCEKLVRLKRLARVEKVIG